jgi:steroid delta-isomerase-like uncharacterized protein
MARSRATIIEAANAVLLAEGRADAVAEFFAARYVAHLTDGAGVRGREAVWRIIKQYRQAFSDLSVEVEILVSARDRVAWQRAVRASHRGAFKGFPATGRPVVWRDMVVSGFDARGRIAEDRVISDLAEQLLRARKR